MNHDRRKKIVFIVGPTAVGKTAVGVCLSKRLAGEVVSCDSMQVYEGISVLSGRPSLEEMGGVAHHLIGHVPLSQEYDVGRYREQALSCIEEIFDRGHMAVVVGGTGLYMKVLLDGIFETGPISGALRLSLEIQLRLKGLEFLYEELKRADPRAAAKISPNDSRRIMRALEVFRATGKPISQWQEEREGLWGNADIMIFGLTMDRIKLYQRIDERVEMMFQNKAVEEVSDAKDAQWSKTAKAIIGVKEILNYLSGRATLDQVKDDIKRHTRRLAKRQLTWFRAEKRLVWIKREEQESAGQVADRILQKMKGCLC